MHATHASTEIPSRPIQKRIEKARLIEEGYNDDDNQDDGRALGALVAIVLLIWIAALTVLAFKYPYICGLGLVATFFFGCLRAACR